MAGYKTVVRLALGSRMTVYRDCWCRVSGQLAVPFCLHLMSFCFHRMVNHVSFRHASKFRRLMHVNQMRLTCRLHNAVLAAVPSLQGFPSSSLPLGGCTSPNSPFAAKPYPLFTTATKTSPPTPPPTIHPSTSATPHSSPSAQYTTTPSIPSHTPPTQQKWR